MRGKIGPEAIGIMRDLVKWHRADILMLNPLSAYHDGDISQNKDNIRFLNGALGALLDELRIGLFAFERMATQPSSLVDGSGGIRGYLYGRGRDFRDSDSLA